MNINLTLIIQMIVFGLLVWGTMSFIWPSLMNQVEARQKKIAHGLAAADRGEQELQQARQGADARRSYLSRAAAHAGILSAAREIEFLSADSNLCPPYCNDFISIGIFIENPS